MYCFTLRRLDQEEVVILGTHKILALTFEYKMNNKHALFGVDDDVITYLIKANFENIIYYTFNIYFNFFE